MEWGLSQISSRELSEWMAFYSLEPWDATQDEWRAAMIAATVANTARDARKQHTAYQPADFMRENYKPAVEVETKPEELTARIDAMMNLFGGTRGNPG